MPLRKNNSEARHGGARGVPLRAPPPIAQKRALMWNRIRAAQEQASWRRRRAQRRQDKDTSNKTRG
eukprot:13078032-Alexandrium_andersonii.AAC.1